MTKYKGMCLQPHRVTPWSEVSNVHPGRPSCPTGGRDAVRARGVALFWLKVVVERHSQPPRGKYFKRDRAGGCWRENAGSAWFHVVCGLEGP